MMKKTILSLLAFSMIQFSYASDFAFGEKVQLENGNSAEIQFKLNNDGTYEAIVRELGNTAKVLCETRFNSYWKMGGAALILWELGYAEARSCDGDTCFLTEFGKKIPLVGGEQVLLLPLKSGVITKVPAVPACRNK